MELFHKSSNFLFQNVKFQRISAVKQEGSIVAGQKDNCADVAARSQFGDYPSVDWVHTSIAKGMFNVLAIAAATEITFEAKPVKAPLVRPAVPRTRRRPSTRQRQDKTVGKSTTNTVCLLDINRRWDKYKREKYSIRSILTHVLKKRTQLFCPTINVFHCRPAWLQQ